MSSHPKSPDAEHPEDDDFLASIRAVREMVNMEFGLAEREARNSRSNDEKEHVGVGDDDDDEEENSGNPDYWKRRCNRLKRELFEEKNRRDLLETKHKRQTTLLTNQLQQIREEAAVHRDTNDTLRETLDSQTKHSKRLQQQLRDSTAELTAKFRGVIAAMEEEKESIAKERDAAFRLLEESRHQIPANHLALRIRQLEENNARLTKDLEGKRVIVALTPTKTTATTTNTTPPAISSSASRQSLRSSRAKAMIQSVLQQKLRTLEDSLEKDARVIASLEQQIATLERAPRASPNKYTLLGKKRQLTESQERLRTKSLEVVGDMVLLQLQRLIEIHNETTHSYREITEGILTDEWETALENLSKNRTRILALQENATNVVLPSPTGKRGINHRGDENRRQRPKLFK